MDVGGDLRRARAARGLSLPDIAQRTKINQSLLRAIEENRFDRVPGGLFTRGYLRAYAREVQLDPESLVERYRSEFEAPAALTEPSIADSASAEDIDSIGTNDGGGSGHAAGLVVVLLIGLAYFGFARGINTPSASAGPKPTDAIEASAPQPIPTSTAGTLDTPRSVPLKLAIQTTANCWVAVSIDGEPVVARLMTAGERVQYEVREVVTIRIGDPAAFTFTLDGIPGRALGTAGTPVNLKFNRQNYKEVLREQPL
jgi:cytoskeleton protein RodZ